LLNVDAVEDDQLSVTHIHVTDVDSTSSAL